MDTSRAGIFCPWHSIIGEFLGVHSFLLQCFPTFVWWIITFWPHSKFQAVAVPSSNFFCCTWHDNTPWNPCIPPKIWKLAYFFRNVDTIAEIFPNLRYIALGTALSIIFVHHLAFVDAIAEIFPNLRYIALGTALRIIFVHHLRTRYTIAEIFPNVRYIALGTALSIISVHHLRFRPVHVMYIVFFVNPVCIYLV